MKAGIPTRIRWFLFGPPIATKNAVHERLPKTLALSVFSSDALSSVAYATEEIMLSLMKSQGFHLAGVALLSLTFPISLVICLLVLIVATSYYQTIHAYPHGGGS